jgi:hypothetical protein
LGIQHDHHPKSESCRATEFRKQWLGARFWPSSTRSLVSGVGAGSLSAWSPNSAAVKQRLRSSGRLAPVASMNECHCDQPRVKLAPRRKRELSDMCGKEQNRTSKAHFGSRALCSTAMPSRVHSKCSSGRDGQPVPGGLTNIQIQVSYGRSSRPSHLSLWELASGIAGERFRPERWWCNHEGTNMSYVSRCVRWSRRPQYPVARQSVGTQRTLLLPDM